MAETRDLGQATDLSRAQSMRRNPWLALDVATDPVALAVSLQRVHELSLTGASRPAGIREVVAASWTRSLAAGVAPEAAGAPVVLTDGELEAARAASPLAPLIDTILLNLATLDANAPHVIAIGDPTANLLWVAGDAATVDAAREMGFQDGAAWAETRAGTNAVGTAAALDHAVQIFSAEHLLAAVHPWTCSAAPIHDPATGELIGIIDLTEPLRRAHPHTLSVAVLVARAAEASLRVRQLESAARRRERWLTTVGSRSRGVLLDARGRVIAARGVTDPPADFNGPLPPGASMESSDGRRWEREDLGDGDVILWLSGRTSAATPRLTVRLLGSRPHAHIGDRKENGLRSLELLAVLAMHPRGLTAEQLALALYGKRGKTVTVRAQVHRLRRHLGEDLLDTSRTDCAGRSTATGWRCNDSSPQVRHARHSRHIPDRCSPAPTPLRYATRETCSTSRFAEAC